MMEPVSLRHSGMTRRRTLELMVAAFVALGTPAFAEYNTKSKRSAKGKDNTMFMSVVNQSGEHISDQELERLVGESSSPIQEQLANSFMRYGNPKKITQVVNRTYSHYLLLSPEKADAMIQLGQTLVTDALAYWNCDLLARPIVSYTIPSREEDFLKTLGPFSEDKRVIIHLIERGGRRFETKVYVEYAQKEVVLNLDLTLPNAGESDRVYDLAREGTTIQLNSRRNTTLWMADQSNVFSFYETPPHEVLHSQISVWTDRYFLDRLRHMKIQPDLLLEKGTVVVARELIDIEEMLVDAISTAWAKSYTQRQGISSSPHYASQKSEELALRVENETPQALIKLYAEEGPLQFLARL